MKNKSIIVLYVSILALIALPSVNGANCRTCDRGSMFCEFGSIAGSCQWDGGIGCTNTDCFGYIAPSVVADKCIDDPDPAKNCIIEKRDWIGNECIRSCHYTIQPTIGCYCLNGGQMPGTSFVAVDVDQCWPR